ncbi:response regulator [Rudanella paleaurantiibacter]|uniref:Response regulator n=1 Tax=Rudanella paleaurantiibacter TaxID=2614655 RepID=A0A7J5TWF4_9BACT|nr:LytTR family DNA-binding domain-containing protein [Rudanella paleaurantiibacter]KAB7728729.1 response regulator [Rudanella paleaurantiibacter]
MNVLLIEDEDLAAERLAKLIREHDDSLTILGPLDSVDDAVDWFATHPQPDLLLLDIHLSDGLSFGIFNRTSVHCPVIFTTAYDQYALRAFSVNSIDYLLKPVDPTQLGRALNKWRSRLMPVPVLAPNLIHQLSRDIAQLSRAYKTRFLVKFGDHLQFRNTDDVAYFYADGKIVYLVSTDNRRYVIDYTLEELEMQLDPRQFFRVNRKVVARINTIRDIRTNVGGRLRLHFQPAPDEEVFVSRERVPEFKAWLEQ